MCIRASGILIVQPVRMQYTVSYKIQGVFSQIKNSVMGIPAIYLY